MKFLIIKYSNSCLKKEIVAIKFQSLKGEKIEVGTKIVVETESNFRLAEVIKFEVDHNILNAILEAKTKFIRIATTDDLNQQKKNDFDSTEVLVYSQSKANELKLEMRFVDSFYTFDRKQLFISYVADTRVDFRELAKILAQKYKTRIELRQIGVRDKAQKIGGIGPCGLFLCCNTFLTDFSSVSIGMAKNQFLALNPTKINGICGRLLCCLKYEDENYTNLKKNFPNIGKMVKIGNMEGKVTEINILNNIYKIELKNKEVVEIKNEN